LTVPASATCLLLDNLVSTIKMSTQDSNPYAVLSSKGGSKSTKTKKLQKLTNQYHQK
jgi:hypothetical protein